MFDCSTKPNHFCQFVDGTSFPIFQKKAKQQVGTWINFDQRENCLWSCSDHHSDFLCEASLKLLQSSHSIPTLFQIFELLVCWPWDNQFAPWTAWLDWVLEAPLLALLHPLCFVADSLTQHWVCMSQSPENVSFQCQAQAAQNHNKAFPWHGGHLQWHWNCHKEFVAQFFAEMWQPDKGTEQPEPWLHAVPLRIGVKEQFLVVFLLSPPLWSREQVFLDHAWEKLKLLLHMHTPGLTQWGHNGDSMDTKRTKWGHNWDAIGTQWGRQWKHNGNTVGTKWKHNGDTIGKMSAQWRHNGDTMRTQWEHNGDTMGTQWKREDTMEMQWGHNWDTMWTQWSHN